MNNKMTLKDKIQNTICRYNLEENDLDKCLKELKRLFRQEISEAYCEGAAHTELEGYKNRDEYLKFKGL
jgi:hypothetical protein